MQRGPSHSNFEAAFARLTENMGSLALSSGGGNANAAGLIQDAFTSAGNAESQYSSAGTMAVDEDEEIQGQPSVSIQIVSYDALSFAERDRNTHRQGEINVDMNAIIYYFLRISPTALDEADIWPCAHTEKDFQLVAWKTSDGLTKTRLLHGPHMQHVDPENDAAYIILFLRHYITEMYTNGHELFLYIRIPDDDGQLEAIGEHMVDICGLLNAFAGLFYDMDVAFTL